MQTTNIISSGSAGWRLKRSLNNFSCSSEADGWLNVNTCLPGYCNHYLQRYALLRLLSCSLYNNIDVWCSLVLKPGVWTGSVLLLVMVCTLQTKLWFCRTELQLIQGLAVLATLQTCPTKERQVKNLTDYSLLCLKFTLFTFPQSLCLHRCNSSHLTSDHNTALLTILLGRLHIKDI